MIERLKHKEDTPAVIVGMVNKKAPGARLRVSTTKKIRCQAIIPN